MNAPASDKPAVVIIGKEVPETDLFTNLLTTLTIPFIVCADGMAAWQELSRKKTGLIILNQNSGPINMMEFLVMLRNDNEFVRVPLLINGRQMNWEEKSLTRSLGYSSWITAEAKEADIKAMIEKLYNQHNVVAGLLASSALVEQKMRQLFEGTNLLMKVSTNTKDFLRRLETADPEILFIDLRTKGDSLNTLLKMLKDDPEWSKIPCVSIAPESHALVKTAASLGCVSNIDEATSSHTDACQVAQKACNKSFFDLPVVGGTPQAAAPTSAAAAPKPAKAA